MAPEKRDTSEFARMRCSRCNSVTVLPTESEPGLTPCPHCFGRLRLEILHEDRRRRHLPVEVDRRS